MSLKAFHRVFILTAFTGFAFTAWWATGHNPNMVRSSWLLASSLGGMALLAPYFVWTVRKL